MQKFMYSLRQCLFFVGVCFFLASCGSRSYVVADANDRIEAFSYKLGSGDKLKINVFGEQELSGEFLVDDSGRVSMPLIGSVLAKNKTLKQFENNVKSNLSKGYLRNPKVSVEVLNYRPYYISGEVNKSNEYPYKAGMTILDAIAIAGGYTYRADKNTVYIRKVGESTDKAYDIRHKNIVIYPGDNITIPEGFL